MGTASVLSLVPWDAHAIQALLLPAASSRAGGLTDAQYALVTAMADTIIPRTDTPSATDVGVHDWIDRIVAEYQTEEERAEFRAGLDAIDARAKRIGGVPFAQLPAAKQHWVMTALEVPNPLAKLLIFADQHSAFPRALERLEGHDLLTRIAASVDRLSRGWSRDVRIYPRLKALVVHGYFTSEQIHKNVLGVASMPGSFDGAQLMARHGARL
jgi:hypothetical protein